MAEFREIDREICFPNVTPAIAGAGHSAYFLLKLPARQNGERRFCLDILRGYHRGTGMLRYGSYVSKV